MNNAPLELWQMIANQLEFKSINVLKLCCYDLHEGLYILCLPQKYGKHTAHKYLKHLTHAKDIYLLNCLKITDEGLKYLSNAKYINLHWCCEITDEGLKYLTNTKNINLEGCDKITDEGLKYLTNTKNINLGDVIK